MPPLADFAAPYSVQSGTKAAAQSASTTHYAIAKASNQRAANNHEVLTTMSASPGCAARNRATSRGNRAL